MASQNKGLKGRLIVVGILLLLGFCGVILTDVSKTGAWQYWRLLVIVYAVLSIGLSIHLRKRGWKSTLFTVWHEIAHWFGLIGALTVVSYSVTTGLIGRFEASVLTLLLLALTTYLAGIYTEPTFIFLGLMLGSFAAVITFLDAYLYNILFPLVAVALVVLTIFIHYTHKKLRGENREDQKQ